MNISINSVISLKNFHITLKSFSETTNMNGKEQMTILQEATILVLCKQDDRFQIFLRV